ncbi:WD repeat, SAM and U-box domain-containing protein 1 [Physocladia obscura]|uniref:WD repeat, SAM and U-box domain-containing protein 1 n=1 Tax=Physocladia obscura TaxID=109957 RepID=A0AAD5XD28_9FUNG|nr:WD repeat, SAM and U-box domain-containing protein 1 [Physocladia obscura]
MPRTNSGLYNNDLSGFVPSSLASLSQLQEIDVSNNYLSGDIPTGFGSLKNLSYIYSTRSSGCSTISVSSTMVATTIGDNNKTTTQTAPTSTNANEKVGVVIGVLAAVFVLIAIGLVLYRRKHAKKQPQDKNTTAVFTIQPSQNELAGSIQTVTPASTNIHQSMKANLFAGIEDANRRVTSGNTAALPLPLKNNLFASLEHENYAISSNSNDFSKTTQRFPPDPFNWTTSDVSRWLAEHGWNYLVPAFSENQVDGRILLSLTPEELKMDFSIHNLNLRTEIKDAIQILKSINTTTNSALNGVSGNNILLPAYQEY